MADAEELRDLGQMRIGDEIAAIAIGMRRHVERELARARAGNRTYAGKPRPVRPVLARVADVVRRIPGAADVYPEQVTGAPYLDIRVNQEAAARYGITIGRSRM